MLPGQGLLGVGTAKKIGNKPRRNRQRRRVQSCFRNLNLPPTEWDCVAIARASVETAPFADLQAEAARLYDQCLSLSLKGSDPS